MIIYQAMAGRLYPKVVNTILHGLLEINMPAGEFHYPYELIDEKDYSNKNNILQMIPKSVKHPRYQGLLYGVFPTHHLNIRKGDFVFTVLNHPVDNIYELYTYWKFTRNSTGPRMPDKVKVAEDENPAKLYSAEKEAFCSSKDWELEDYIEKILNKETIYIEHKDVKYEFMSEMFYGYKTIDHFDFMGKFSDLPKTFNKLEKVLNCEFEIQDQPHTEDQNKINSYSGIHYKRKELEELLKDQIEIYENLDELFPE
jgi:hypothetical protein